MTESGTTRNVTALRRACRQLFNEAYAGSAPPAPELDLEELTGPEVFHWIRHHRLQALFASCLPALHARVQGQMVYTARLTMVAEHLASHFEAAIGPSCYLVKGPALAAQAWPHAGWRSFDDLDFRCARTDLTAMHAGLIEAGFRPLIESAILRRHYWQFGWGLTYRHVEGYWTEINHRLFVPHFPCPRELDRSGSAFEQLVSVRLDSASVRAPHPAFHLIICSLHAVWHGGERLAWFLDIAGLLRRHPACWATAWEWPGADDFTRRCLLIGRTVAQRWFDSVTEEPEQAIGALRPVVDRIDESLVHQERLSAAQLHTLHLALLSRPSRIIVSLRRLLTPGDGDFRAITFSDRWRWLYWLLRPLRLLIRFGRGAAR